jgi:hypothetical protein
MYIQCSNLRRKSEQSRSLENRLPDVVQNALCGAVSGSGTDDRLRGGAEGHPRKTPRPADRQRPSTIFQRLPRRLNDLRKNAGSLLLRYALSQWSPVSNARHAENGTRLRSTSPPEGARVTSKTAKSAASRTCCAWSTTRRGRHSSLPLSWNRRAGVRHLPGCPISRALFAREVGIFALLPGRGRPGLHKEHRSELVAHLLSGL